MAEIKKPLGWWNDKNHCIEEAQKYKSRIEFRRKSKGCYEACRKYKWLDDICSHMISQIE